MEGSASAVKGWQVMQEVRVFRILRAGGLPFITRFHNAGYLKTPLRDVSGDGATLGKAAMYVQQQAQPVREINYRCLRAGSTANLEERFPSLGRGERGQGHLG